MLKEKILRVLPFSFFMIIYFLSIIPQRDFDLWFHVKSGEIIMQKGLIHYDVFSHSAAGREWFPYEWLYQISVYNIQQLAGFESIKYFNAVLITGMIAIVYLVLSRIIKLQTVLSLVVTFLFYVSIYEFLTARPHVLAYSLLITNLFLILLYFKENKNVLWLTVPVTLIWANMHGSIFLDIYFFGAYAFLSLLNAKLNLKESSVWLQKCKTLSFFTLFTSLLTILPPLGFTQYRLLWMFFQNRDFIPKFIDEWTPLALNPVSFMFVSASIAVTLSFFVLAAFLTKKDIRSFIWLLPLLPFLVLTYTASRNVFLAYITLVYLLGYACKMLWESNHKLIKYLLFFIFLSLVASHMYILSLKKVQIKMFYPVKATRFIKEQNIKGNMFNEYGYGGYLLYQLYPQQKVFFDGRTDVYLCCEMRDTMKLTMQKNLPDSEFKKALDELWNKYNISFVLIRTEKHNVLRKIGHILSNDPEWSLVFWDDYAQLFVRRDGKNDTIIRKFGTSAVTPWEKNPYRPNTEDHAMKEYVRMISIADSSKSRNAMGYLYLLQNKYNEAQTEFIRATEIDPTNESPYMNLAELQAKDGNLDEAIALYNKAKLLAPDRGLIYIRLGQLILEKDQNIEEARIIWKHGVENTIEQDTKKKLESLVSSGN